ncbi:MAG: hypothetical protein KC420_08300 [Myxococcales bacterium]|nr:hypothetical protein [Myxococcales bacterium]
MLGPSAREATGLTFSFGSFGLGVRYLVALPLALIGAALIAYDQRLLLGLAAIACAHALLWVKRLTTAPGAPLDPLGEETWAPADEGWLRQMVELEQKGERWDVSPWDISSPLGFGVLVLLVGGALVLFAYFVGTFDLSIEIAALALLVPIWFNGMRSNWNPGLLRLKGSALATATQAAREVIGERYDVVPLLALRDGPRGKYPVDARTMLRPKAEGPLIGVQIQVALNNVRGVNYPYLYCVVLVKEDHKPPTPFQRKHKVVYEPGKGGGVRFLVVRQHADNSGGWHTGPTAISALVREAVSLANTVR